MKSTISIITYSNRINIEYGGCRITHRGRSIMYAILKVMLKYYTTAIKELFAGERRRMRL